MKFKMIEHTEENRKNLEYGAGYVVQYWCNVREEYRAAVGIWQGGDFFYPTMLTRLPPPLSHVKYWSCVKQWRPDSD